LVRSDRLGVGCASLTAGVAAGLERSSSDAGTRSGRRRGAPGFLAAPFGCAATGPSVRDGGREPEASHVALLTSRRRASQAAWRCQRAGLRIAGAGPDEADRLRLATSFAHREKLLYFR
jgi:hypothetical protein